MVAGDGESRDPNDGTGGRASPPCIQAGEIGEDRCPAAQAGVLEGVLFGVCSGVAVGVGVGVHVGVGAGMRTIEPALLGGVCCAAARWRGLRIPDARSERGGERDTEEDRLQSP